MQPWPQTSPTRDPHAARWLTTGERRALHWMIIAGVGLWAVVGPMGKIPLTVDEGQHLIGARHILLDGERLIRHFRYVGGYDSWAEIAATYWTYPPTLDALYAGALGLFGVGPVAHGLPLMAAQALMVWAVWSVVRRLAGPDAALLAAVLVTFSRAALDQGLMIECEPFVAALGMAALALGLRGMDTGSRACLMGAGGLMGAAFLFKLWLVFPYVLVLGALILWGPGPARLARRLSAAAIVAVAFVVVGGAHLAFIAALAPEDLPLWRAVYLAAILREAPPTAVQPRWFYAAALYRDLGPAALPAALGAALLFRGLISGPRRPRALGVLPGGAIVSALMLTASGRKEALYLYPLAPLFMIVVATGLQALARGEALPRRALRALSIIVGIGMLAAVAAVSALWMHAFAPQTLTEPFVVTHGIVMGLTGTAVLFGGGLRPQGRALATALTLSLISWGVIEAGHRISEHREEAITPVAAYISAASLTIPPAAPGVDSFVSPFWLPVGYYTWQRGKPWSQAGGSDDRALDPIHAPNLRWFQIHKRFEPSLGALPDADTHAATLAALRLTMIDVTAEVEALAGRPLTTYVFIRPAL